MYLTHEGESVVAKSFIRTLKNKIYKYMTLILKNVYTDKLDNVFNEYSNTYKYIQQYIYIYIYIYIYTVYNINTIAVYIHIQKHIQRNQNKAF